MNNSLELSPSQILERVKPDRVTVTKPEEDRRRRTIIVEKKNGNYGFTLQSYGIHYKKEQEIEMITYVDHVDYDGPAFRAGMREGDVILSINGRDMEKADHKSLVNFIKSCDTRMRMVVLFEDCVRKVELHMRYIRLQNALKSKTLELEKLCVKEKELMSGKWKTHSLPARKKTVSATKNSECGPKVPTDNEEHLKRSTVSTEDVAQSQPYERAHHHFLIAYPRHPPYYIDSHGRAYYIHPSAVTTPSASKEYLVKSPSDWSSTQQLEVNQNLNYCRKDSQRRRSTYTTEDRKPSNMKENLSNCYRNSVNQCSKALSKSNLNDSTSVRIKDGQKVTRNKSYHQQICGGCLSGEKNTTNRQVNQENGCLEAYDLADSPCCSAECVPTRRRRSHNQHPHKLKHSSSKTSLQFSNLNKDHCEGHSSRSTQVNISTSFQGSGFPRKYSKTENARALDPSYHLVSQHSLLSCTSSSELPNSRTVGEQSATSYTTFLSTDTLYWDQPSNASSGSFRKHSVQSSSGRRYQDYVKPVKSLDNLTSKSRGREYFDTETGKSYSSKNVSRTRPNEQYFNTTKSSESLFYSQNLSDANFSCEYLNHDNPTFISNEDGRFVAVMPSDLTNHRDKASQTDSNKRLVDVPQTPEITRL